MDFFCTDEQAAIREMAKNFADKEMLPLAKEWDENYHFPKDVLRKAAGLGMAMLYVRPELGGSGLSRLDSALIFEELATACPSTAAYLSIHNMVSWIIDTYGNAEQQQAWLPKMSTMESFGSYCLTEPNAGSDAGSLRSTATLEQDHYILNGAKAFISGGSESDVYICMMRTAEKQISCFLVEKDTPGLSFGNHEKKLGWHSQPTTMIYFDQVRIPKSHLIGEAGQGFKIALSALNGGRINIAACSLGGAKHCLQATRQYMKERLQFQQPLADFEGLQFRYADMATEFEAARLMVYRAAHMLDKKDPEIILHCAMAKRFATDLCYKVCDQALQLHGGYGYLQDYGIERYVRDLRAHQIVEGTNEIMRLIIAKQVFADTFQLI